VDNPRPEVLNSDAWCLQAARNIADVLPYFPAAGLQGMDAGDMALKIKKKFHDRETWNETIRNYDVSGCVKLWLILP
jgi:hypothetical protein